MVGLAIDAANFSKVGLERDDFLLLLKVVGLGGNRNRLVGMEVNGIGLICFNFRLSVDLILVSVVYSSLLGEIRGSW